MKEFRKILALSEALSSMSLHAEAKSCLRLIKMSMPMLDGEYVSPNKIYGDFIYTLRLENLGDDGLQIVDEPTGRPIYKWYVGETSAPLLRTMEHNTVFKKDSLEIVPRADVKNYIEKELISGSKYTLENRVLEVVHVKNVTNLSLTTADRRRARHYEENVQRALVQSIVGKGMVFGGHYKPEIDILIPENINAGAEIDSRKIIEGIHARTTGSTDFDITDILNSLNNENITEKDIKIMKDRRKLYGSNPEAKAERDVKQSLARAAFAQHAIAIAINDEISSIDDIATKMHADSSMVLDSVYYAIKYMGSNIISGGRDKVRTQRVKQLVVEFFLNGLLQAKRNGALQGEDDVLSAVVAVDSYYDNFSPLNTSSDPVNGEESYVVSSEDEAVIRSQARAYSSSELSSADMREIMSRAEGYRDMPGVGRNQDTREPFGRKRFLEAVTGRYMNDKILSDVRGRISEYRGKRHQEPEINSEYYDLLRHHEDMVDEFSRIVGRGMSDDISTWDPSEGVLSMFGSQTPALIKIHILWLSQIKCIQDNNWENILRVYSEDKQDSIRRGRTRARGYLKLLGASDELLSYLSVSFKDYNRKTGRKMDKNIASMLSGVPCV